MSLQCAELISGRCLARLRRSTAYGVLGLAAIAIAGCSAETVCHEGVLYTDYNRDGVFQQASQQSEPIKCIQTEGN